MTHKPKFFNNLSFVLHSWRKKPALVFRSLFFFFAKAAGRSVIRGMDIAVTYKCNLKCDHCNIAGQVDSNRREISAADIISTIRQLKRMGGFYVTFTGGEPLLELSKIETVINAVGRRAMLYQIQTNGVLLSDNMCRRLKKIGIDNIQVSFDDFHEHSNWQNVLEKKRNQLHLLRSWGFDVIFTWLASHKSLNSKQLDDIINFSNTHRVKIGLNFAVPQGRWEGEPQFLLTKADSLKLREISHNNPYLYIDLQNNLFNFGCPAFSERLHINAYGDVQPCTFFQISFGNIKEKPLRRIRTLGCAAKLFAGFPDHCPPAENNRYIDKILGFSETTRFPIDHTQFFSDKETHNISPEYFTHSLHASRQPLPDLQCVLCGGPITTPHVERLQEVEYGTQWTGSAYACQDCGLIHQVPLPTALEAIAAYPDAYIHYNPYVSGLKGFLMKLYMNRTIKLLKRLNARPGKTLLDIGCGAGEKLAIIRDKLQLDVIGVEPSKKAASKAADLFELHVIADFFEPDRFAPESFDFVRINHVIEHVPDPVRLLNDIFRILKPGGWLIGETENTDCLSLKIFGRYWALFHFPYHLLLFNRSTLALAFQKSRFRQTSITDLLDPPAWSLSMQNVLRRNQPIAKRPSSRMPGYTILTILCYPLTWLEKICGGGAVIAFQSRKPLSNRGKTCQHKNTSDSSLRIFEQ